MHLHKCTSLPKVQYIAGIFYTQPSNIIITIWYIINTQLLSILYFKLEQANAMIIVFLSDN